MDPQEIKRFTNEQLLPQIHTAVTELTTIAETLPTEKFNAVPYAGSWTPGQLLRHVTKSIKGMTGAMKSPGEPAPRDPAERVEELKKIFLDFNHKLTSPEFIVPEDIHYDRQASTEELLTSETSLANSAAMADGSVLVKGLPFGPVTKFELLHFVLFHTQRHVHQMKKMVNGQPG